MSNFIQRWKRSFTSWLNIEDAPAAPQLRQAFERVQQHAQTGDVILLQGHSVVSKKIAGISGCPWSLAALYLGRIHDIEDRVTREMMASDTPCSDDTQLVLFTNMGEGAVIRPLSHFEHHQMRLCRARGISPEDTQQVVRYAVNQLGQKNMLPSLFNLVRYLMPWSWLPASWREPIYKARINDALKQSTAGLIVDAFTFARFPVHALVIYQAGQSKQIYRQNKQASLPRSFDDSPYFDIIKSPYSLTTDDAKGDLLPWKGKNLLVNQEQPLPSSNILSIAPNTKEHQESS